MSRQASAILLICLIAAAACADRVDDYVKAQMDQRRIPGLVLTVITNGKVAKTAAYGLANVEVQAPVRIDTVFEIGSVTKQFTAALILMLVDEGKLAVDDKISRFFDNAPETWKDVTVRHLLTHTAGIRNYTSLPGFEVTKRLDAKKFVAAIGAYPLETKPGETFKYSNTGYNLLGYIIERITARSYWDVLRARILEPLEMRATTSRDSKPTVSNRAAGYELKNGVVTNRDSNLTDVFSAGAIVSTVGDLVKWNAALDARKFLSPATYEAMWQPVSLNSGERRLYGFGWRLDDHKGRRQIWHSGSTSGFTSSLLRFPDEKLAIIVLCNQGEQSTATHVARGVADLLSPSEGRALSSPTVGSKPN